MQFSSYSRFTLVAGLHVLVGALFLHNMSTRKIAPSLPDPVLVMMQPEPPKLAPPPDPPKPMQQLAPPAIVVPVPDVQVAPPVEPTVRASHEAEPAPPHPFTPMQSVSDAPPASNANTNTNASQMRTAVLADANSCALPDYPASAARNGETGITTLALLVGVDGRVSSARIEHGSGSRVLDRAALNALSLCRFKPATSNGVPEAGWAQLAFVWKLD